MYKTSQFVFTNRRFLSDNAILYINEENAGAFESLNCIKFPIINPSRYAKIISESKSNEPSGKFARRLDNIDISLLQEENQSHSDRMEKNMANKSAKKALEQVKMQAASEVGVTLNNNGYNGDLTSRQAGSIGGQMVKKMIESYENSMGATPKN